ncbi:MAG: STAS domain-containing protein [Planctomycetes bacterium]|nr:STAS domain-containing protein [Planctomycetota bacterium]
MRKFELKTQIVQKTLCARLSSDVDSGNAVILRSELAKAIQNGPPVVLLDLADVRKMDSAGIAVLVEMHDRLKQEGRQMGLINTPETVRGLLELLGVFEIYADMETGLKATKKLQANWQRLHDPTKPVE